jgi:hypothetical protein
MDRRGNTRNFRHLGCLYMEILKEKLYSTGLVKVLGEFCTVKKGITHCPAEFRNLVQSTAGEIRLKLLPP